MSELATITSLGFSIFSTYSGRGVSAARRDINQLNRDLSSNIVTLNSASRAFFSLSTAALALGPGLATVGSAAAAGTAGLITMAAAGGGAAAVLGVAVVAAMHGTNAAAKDMQASVKGVSTAFVAWGNQVAPLLRGPVTTAVNAVSSSFTRFTPLVARLAPLANQVANAFARWTQTNLPGWVSWLGSTGTPILANFVTVGRNLARVFGDMLRAFGPMAISISQGLANMSARMREWADGGGFVRFLNTVRANGPQVSAFFQALVAAIANVAKAMAGLGPISLSLTTVLLKLVAAMPPWLIQAIVVAILAWRTAMLVYAAATTIATAAQIAFTVASSPFLIFMAGAALTVLAFVAALAALGVGLYFLVTNWNTVWNAIKQTAITVWNFLTTGLGQLVTALLGPIGVLILLAAHWNTVWNGMKVVAQAIWLGLQTAWRAVVNSLLTAWTAVSGALRATWNAVWNAMRTAAVAVWNAMRAAWTAVINAMRTVMTSVLNAMRAAWQAVWNAMRSAGQAVWNAMRAAWTAVLNAMRSVMTSVINAMRATWQAVWNAMRSAGQAVWNAMRSAFTAFMNAMRSVMTSVMNAMRSAWNAVWNAIRAAAQAVWNAMRSAFTAFMNAMRSILTSAMNAMKSVWSGAWNAIRSTAQTVWNAIRAGFNAFANGVKSTISGLVDAVKKIWSGIVAAFKGPIDTIIGIWNKVAGAIGLDSIKLNGGGSTGGFQVGGTFKANGGALSSKMAGTQRNDRIPALLSAGEYVVRASSVRKYGTGFLNQVNAGRFASGGVVTPMGKQAGVTAPAMLAVGGWIPDPGGILKDIAGFVKDVAGWITKNVGQLIGPGLQLLPGFDDLVKQISPLNIGDVMKPLLNILVDRIPDPLPPGTPKPAGSIIHASIKKLVDSAVSFFADKQKAAFASFAVAGAQSVQSWAPLVSQALAMTGAPASWLGGILSLMAAESGGNPNAINGWDINAQNGVPSQGLMQVIPPTFLAYHQPGTSFNILDPLANIAAAINYIKARYGYVPGSPYASGTSNASRGWHLVGEHGPEMRWFNGGEAVWDSRKSRRWMRGGGDGGPVVVQVENHWHGNPSKEAVQYAESGMAEKLRQACAAGVGGRAH